MHTTSVQSFDLFAGDSRALTFTVVDDSGNNVDLTGASAIWEMAPLNWKSSAASPLLTKTSAAGGITLANGSFTLKLASTDTEGLTEGSYYHEAQITLADGITIGTPLSGRVKVKSNLIAPR
jgi:hypothetical protein